MATLPAGLGMRKRAERTRKTERPERRKAAKLSRLHKPEGMSLEDWQIELRRQFGRDQHFDIVNVGDHPYFSEFEVTNPQNNNSYRVAIRGRQPGDNFCSCPDFATNALGTCKHVEFTLGYLERKRGGRTALRDGFQPAYSEVYLQYGARREVRFRPGSECPVGLARLATDYFGSDGRLQTEAFAKFETFLAEAARFEHDLRCFEDVLAFVAEVRDAERRRERLHEAFPRGSNSAAFNKLLRIPLYEYQRQGALFAARAGRCLIGDEMGLGKTIQAIAAAEIMAKWFGVERVLVVCPTSLKHQWEREISRFAERTVRVIGGMRARREQLFAAESFYKITNYDTIHRDLALIASWSPDLVILDEAQRIKNWQTRAAQSVKKILSPYAVVLTGTPLENRLEELVSIVQFVDRHRLGPTYRLLHDHQIRDEVGRVVGYRNLDRIGKSLEPVLLRRQKDQVLDQLPARLDKNFFVSMTPLQRQHHEENREMVARIVAKWRRYRFLSEADQRRLMIGLQNMRMACDSTYLLDRQTDSGVKADELATLLEEVFEQPDAKVVIFSQWLRMHELLVRRFKERGWDYVLFHGGVPGPQRRGLVDRFREDPRCRAFLATDAGGVGLNLQHASVVVNMDLPWNPAVLEQRIGRVHRLGQRLPVRVVNFVAQGTIEEGMLSLLKFKKSLFAGVLDGGEKEVFLGGSRLSRFMETVEKATKAIPAAVPEERSEASPAAEPVDSEPAAPEAAAQPVGAAATTAPADPWSGLVQSGMALLQQLSAAARAPAPSGNTAAAPGLSLVARDERTGETYLKLPIPKPEVLEQALQAFTALLKNLRRE
ncbi:MAG TPA: DEAD/DEAH box helicase [Gemmataceae bacterium]|nr:DEAD/DEAH box helicase [Gemmataceae bacterium]